MITTQYLVIFCFQLCCFFRVFFDRIKRPVWESARARGLPNKIFIFFKSSLASVLLSLMPFIYLDYHFLQQLFVFWKSSIFWSLIALQIIELFDSAHHEYSPHSCLKSFCFMSISKIIRDCLRDLITLFSRNPRMLQSKYRSVPGGRIVL